MFRAPNNVLFGDQCGVLTAGPARIVWSYRCGARSHSRSHSFDVYRTGVLLMHYNAYPLRNTRVCRYYGFARTPLPGLRSDNQKRPPRALASKLMHMPGRDYMNKKTL